MKEEKITLKYKANTVDSETLTPEMVADMISNTGKAFDRARASAQRSAVSVMVLAIKFPLEAVTLANTLSTCMGAGVKGVGMVKFLRDMGGFQLDAEGEEFYAVKNAEWLGANLKKAKAKMWWSYVPDKPFQGMNFLADIKAVIDKANAMEKGKNKRKEDDKSKIEIDMAMVRTISALIGGAPVHGDDALALVQKLVPAAVIPFPEKAKEEKAVLPELPAVKEVVNG